MAYCSKCGAEVPVGASFCPRCGQMVNASVPAGTPVPAGAPAELLPSTHFLSEHVAGLLCYVLGWVSGLVFFLMDKRPFVRFHAAQAMVVFGGLLVLDLLIGLVFGAPLLAVAGVGVGRLASDLIGLVGFVLWIVLMIKAYQGQQFHVPIAGDIAENLARKQANA